MNILPPDWNLIDTVLLDMDGTLLDKYFDDHFWEEYVPACFAQKNRIAKQEAKENLMGRYLSIQGTLDWFDVDFWSKELDLDIPSLKRQVQHLIAVHPDVIPFLERLGTLEKGVYLVTNAHGKTLDLKMERTNLAHRFDGIITSHEIGIPKENPAFWEHLEKVFPFDPERTLLADDTEEVLFSAARYGIRYLVFIAGSSSAKPPRDSDSFYSIKYFGEIMP